MKRTRHQKGYLYKKEIYGCSGITTMRFYPRARFAESKRRTKWWKQKVNIARRPRREGSRTTSLLR
jgi:hypothetical protein